MQQASLLYIVLCFGWIVAALSICVNIGLYRANAQRTEDVRMWAEGAFEKGHDQCNLSIESYQHNKKFSVDAVVEAHLGAWH
jgi:hypothetical protein